MLTARPRGRFPLGEIKAVVVMTQHFCISFYLLSASLLFEMTFTAFLDYFKSVRTIHGRGKSRFTREITSQNHVQLTRKRIKKIHASYTLEGTNLENVESIKYLGVTITTDLRWNTHVSNVCTKANRTLGFLRRNLYSCYSVWDPPGVVLQEQAEPYPQN